MQKLEDIIIEAKRCLNCKNPLCKTGCPVKTNIPQFINEIKNNNLQGAYNILQENNIMSDICSNVCPYEVYCTGHCVKSIKEEPINVSKLEKFVNIWARENNITYKYNVKPCNNIKIAIIGSGPAGIACSTELIKEGFKVTIFEKEEDIGGLLTYGIPGFRLPRDITNNLKQRLNELKIEIKTKVEFGKDITIEDLKKDGYKAIFICIGDAVASTYKLAEEECQNIYKANYILKEYNAKRRIENLGDVIIIGGGNVATDSARAAIRMGAKSATIIYRRNQKNMTAREIELNHAKKDGVKAIFNTKVLEADIKNNEITKVKCIKTIFEDNILKDIEKSEYYIDANSIIFAIGLKPDVKLLEKERIKLTESKIEIDENYMTNIEGVFAGGDVCKGKATVCKAIDDGKEAAKQIISYISLQKKANNNY